MVFHHWNGYLVKWKYHLPPTHHFELMFQQIFPILWAFCDSHATNRTLTPTAGKQRSVWTLCTLDKAIAQITGKAYGIISSICSRRKNISCSSKIRFAENTINFQNGAWIYRRSSHLFSQFCAYVAVPNTNKNVYTIYAYPDDAKLKRHDGPCLWSWLKTEQPNLRS